MAVLGTTGMRESEILGLRWDDFDIEKQVILVRRSRYRGEINPTKSEGSERAIPYGDIVSDALTRLRASGQSGKEYLFVTPKGSLFRGSDVGKKVFRTAAKELGTAGISLAIFPALGGDSAAYGRDTDENSAADLGAYQSHHNPALC